MRQTEGVMVGGLREVWRIGWPWLRPHWPALLWAVLLMLLQSLATLIQPWLGGKVVERLLHTQEVSILLLALFVAFSAQALLGYATMVQLKKVGGLLVAEASSRVYAHLQALPLAWHHERQRGDVLALLTGDIHRIGDFWTAVLLPFVPLLITLGGASWMMWHLSPAIAAGLAILVPMLMLPLKLAGRRLRPLGQASAQAWAAQSALAGQNLELLPILKAFATDVMEAQRYRDGAYRLADAQLRQVRWQGLIFPLVQIAGAGTVLLLLGLAQADLLAGRLQIGSLVSVFLYGVVLINPVGQLANVYGQIQTARGAAQRLLEVMQTAPEPDTGTIDALPLDGDIVFDRVTFAYPGRDPVLSGFSLRIRAGETLAITGSNGVGKSTLAHLLLRLYEPDQGAISIGGIELPQFRLATLRRQIGLVPQQVLLFHASVRANIAYGRADADDAAIERAARAARAHDFIQALPNGYDTIIGDQGVKLSGGQRQRLALARALLRDPAILILDEATAMFDPAGEAEFIHACRDVLQSRTVLLITHRPASLALADRVIRLGGGGWEKIPSADADGSGKL